MHPKSVGRSSPGAVPAPDHKRKQLGEYKTLHILHFREVYDSTMKKFTDTWQATPRCDVIKLEGVDRNGNRVTHFVHRLSALRPAFGEPKASLPKHLLN